MVHSTLFRLFISNELTDPLVSHCLIEGLDVGFFPIQPGGMNGLSVNIDDPKQSANITCDLDTDKLHGQYVLFDNTRDSQRCGDNKCEWHVKNDGLYLDIQGQQVFQAPWFL
ncbi:uncharacterized protein LOC132611612 [Lycium barbarum]|uniref:uncharacterized protein LOC132611612 n=1 Tax=Lycium barbarum TaxID=112863 RepID=UPI00293F1E88|nr:uncharacterized protein LOC132611612 [Lycium barbarum]